MLFFTTLVLLHVAFFSVLENTIFVRAVMPRATSGTFAIACGVGQ